MDWTLIGIVAAVVVVAVIVIFVIKMPRGPAVPETLRPGNPLPPFDATDEQGQAVSSESLKGSPAAVLFVRGNWCPFCTKEVEKLTQHYKDINDLGARVVFVTPKPLETTRRVAEFFEVDFDFWFDEDLRIADSFGLRMPKGVPKDSLGEYGPDTVWPTALIVDADGVIQYANLARYIFNRPDPEALLKQLRKIA